MKNYPVLFQLTSGRLGSPRTSVCRSGPFALDTCPGFRELAVGTAAQGGLIKLSGPVTLDGRPVETGATASCPPRAAARTAITSDILEMLAAPG